MDLHQLTDVPEEKRDIDWENQFLDALPNAKLKVLSADPQQGPDGWPYLLVETTTDAGEPAQKILEWLSMRGIGLVVNPTKGYPDFVLSFGMLWNFKQNNRFIFAQSSVPTGTIEMKEGQGLHAGIPSKEYLPDYVRNILREFFRDQSVLAPKILVMSQDRVHYDLAFSLESLGNPPEKEHQGIAEALSWFLPPHYSLILISEKDLPPFVEL